MPGPTGNRVICLKFSKQFGDSNMMNYLRSAILIFLMVAFIGCAGGKASRWGHFHGDLSSRGFKLVNSGFALSSSWISNPYRITTSSPVIGLDYQRREVLYIGTTNAKLIAIKSEDGTEKWQRSLKSTGSKTHIVSSASVSDRGDIYIIANRKADDGRIRSTLHKVDQFSNPKWSYAFPDNGYTSGSPKVVTYSNHTLIFIYLSVGMVDDVQGELYVLRDDGSQAKLLDHKPLGTCRFDVPGSRVNFDEAISTLEETWDLFGDFPANFDAADAVLPDRFVDPTVAVVTVEENLLIAVADNLCSIGVFEWNADELSALWRQEHDFDKHSSTAVLTNGLMVFGRQDGKVLAYDVQTGVKMWQYDAGQAVFATPAGSPEHLVFVVSKDHLQAIKAADGSLIYDPNFSGKLALMGATHASPAITVNRVYVSAFEMLTTTYDLKTRASDTNFHGNGLSSIAIGRDGAVYAVASDGTIRKYAGTE
jgi:outer membrane protein assembly factor BamB